MSKSFHMLLQMLIIFSFQMIGFFFTVLYLQISSLGVQPALGVPFFWFIPHGIDGLHFHHDLEVFLITPLVWFLWRKKIINLPVAFNIISFFLGMAIHHFMVEGLRLITWDV